MGVDPAYSELTLILSTSILSALILPVLMLSPLIVVVPSVRLPTVKKPDITTLLLDSTVSPAFSVKLLEVPLFSTSRVMLLMPWLILLLTLSLVA